MILCYIFSLINGKFITCICNGAKQVCLRKEIMYEITNIEITSIDFSQHRLTPKTTVNNIIPKLGTPFCLIEIEI